MERSQNGLSGIIELCHVRGIHLMVFIYCHDEANSPHYDLYEAVLRSEDVPFFTLPLGLCLEKQYKNSIVDGHPNVSGHRLIAQEMFKVLRPLLVKMTSDIKSY